MSSNSSRYDITNAQANSRKLGASYGQGKKAEILKAPTLIEVKVLARPPDINRSTEISMTLRRY
jgi:hypothetical protein